MYYCNECAAKEGWPTHDMQSMSYGLCEVCKQQRPCNYVPSCKLPERKTKELIEAGLRVSRLKELLDNPRLYSPEWWVMFGEGLGKFGAAVRELQQVQRERMKL